MTDHQAESVGRRVTACANGLCFHDDRWECLESLAEELSAPSPVDLSEVHRVRAFAREERNRVISEGRADEPMTLMQHWSAIGGFLDWWMRVVERGDDPTMPDAMRSGITPEETHDE